MNRILALKTAAPVAEIYLLAAGAKPEIIRQKTWEAGRNLAHDLLGEIEGLVGDFANLSGVVVFRGPGSFTGLRIGITTGNAIAYAQNIPIVGVGGEDWLGQGLGRLDRGENDKIVIPNYGAPPNITRPKK